MTPENLSTLLKTYRLNQEEYGKICEILGRPPKGVEWALFSALWSEHCSYKSSKIHLKRLYNSSSRVLQSMGENAGIIDLGKNEKVAFKMESHNHPSFIEPYQGAATGVGGILRDIFTMGARPIALANYLCFGEADAPRMKSLVDGVVRGIGGYGNCVGVPTITGQTEFHKSYNKNILVNALAVGLFRDGEPICLSKAKGVGNLVVYVGAKTGRDGVHGASMASESFDSKTESKKPTVQIGDPFYEKLLIESCLEVMKQDLVVAIQDMGAAGLTSSSFEMAAKGGVGFEIHLDQVPLRDSTMNPEEILLSESQERMLLVCEPRKLASLQKVFHRWGLDATQIGLVNEKKTVTLFWKGEALTEIDPSVLVDEAPVYRRPYNDWVPTRRTEKSYQSVNSEKGVMLDILKSLQGTTRSWVYQQYDQRVGASTVRDCAQSVGVVRLPDSGRALGLVLGCRPHIMRFDAHVGGIDSVVFPALELAAKGFRALAITDCLNFASPEREQIMTEFVGALGGMNGACENLDIPIISGNVSFYNETNGQGVTSTPATGIVGLREYDLETIPHDQLRNVKEAVVLVRLTQVQTGGMLEEVETSKIHGRGQIDLRPLNGFVRTVEEVGQKPFVSATRVVGKFGLGYALAKMTLSGVGLRVEASVAEKLNLFEENLYEVIVSLPKSHVDDLKKMPWPSSTEIIELGVSGGDSLTWGDMNFSISDLSRSYNVGLGGHFEGLA